MPLVRDQPRFESARVPKDLPDPSARRLIAVRRGGCKTLQALDLEKILTCPTTTVIVL